MKTTKKGFTLIELIVVIAIIGVLAAILVPSMLGYVKKSKIQGANSTANTFIKAFNSAATDLDELDCWFKDGTFTFTNGSVAYSALTSGKGEIKDSADVVEAIQPFFSDVNKIKGAIKVESGIGIAAAVQSGKYYGTYPVAYNVKDTQPTDIPNALTAAVNKAKGTSSGTGSGTPAPAGS